MQILSRIFTWWKNQAISVKLIWLLVLILTCCICSIPVSIIRSNKTPTPQPVSQDESAATSILNTPVPTNTSTPTDTPRPTNTLVPTNTPAPTNTSTPIPEKPQCKRELNLFDFSPDSVKIVDGVLGDMGCVEYFSLYEPQSGRFFVDTGLVISTNISREQVLQMVYDINRKLFTSNLGITCVRIFVYSPDNRTIPGLNQALGYELAQEFNGSWDTTSAQEWWSWLEVNRTPSEQISENCEMNHWAQWDKRTEVAPWK